MLQKNKIKKAFKPNSTIRKLQTDFRVVSVVASKIWMFEIGAKALLYQYFTLLEQKITERLENNLKKNYSK